MSGPYKHEARTSLLSGSSVTLDHRDSYQQPYPPQYPVDSAYSPFAGGYHQREGFAPTTARDQKTPLLYIPTTRWTILFMVLAVAQAIIGLTLEVYVFALFGQDVASDQEGVPVARVIPTYLSLFIFGFVYQVLLTYDALRMKNTIQVIGLCAYDVGLLVEAAVQHEQIKDAVARGLSILPTYEPTIQPIVIALPIVIGAFFLGMCFTAWKLSDEFAWSIYKNISADLRMKRRYLSYLIYIALLKFDFFFFLAFTIQFLVVVPSGHVEFGLTVAAIPITIILLFMAAYWTRREALGGMLIIMVVYFGALAYFLFKLVRIYDADADRIADYYPARRSLTIFAVITVILVVVTIVYNAIVALNFNKGLKPHIMSGRKRRRAGSSDMDKLVANSGNVPLSGGLSGPGPSRMTID